MYWISNFYATFLLQQKIYIALIPNIVHGVYEFCVGDPKFPILYKNWPKAIQTLSVATQCPNVL